MTGIGKSYPGVRALHDVSFDVHGGEIHALIGENGAGKSTLMRVLSGVVRPDAGGIRLDGEEIVLTSPADALRRGVAMVYQDTRLAPDLDGAANLFLGREKMRGPLIDRRRMLDEAARLAPDIDLRRPVGELSRAESQMLEIARATARHARVLILDEPTSALTAAETAGLFALLRRLRAEGVALIFISHRIPEVLELADRITVLKDGEAMGTLPVAEATPERLVAMMVGRALSLAFPPRAGALGPVVLEAGGMTVRAGEILGLGGVQGAGQQDFARALFGVAALPTDVVMDGRARRLRGPRDALAAGIAYVPADRRGEGLFLPHSIRENVAVPHLRAWSRLGVLSGQRERREVLSQTSRLRVRTPSIDQVVSLLSGGNQQKIVFARWLIARPRIYVLDEPTQGVDVQTKLELYRIIRGLASDGAAVVVVSSDALELIGLCDRIAVFAAGRVVAEMPAAEATEARVIGAAVRADHRTDFPATSRTAPIKTRALLLRRYGAALVVAALIAALVMVAASNSPYFLTSRTLASLQVQAAPLVLAALGQLAVILCGGIDLSVGPVISLVTCIASFLIVEPGSVSGVVACLAVGLLVGGINAVLTQALRIPDLIATLSTYSVVTGLALIVRPAPGGTIDAVVSQTLTQRIGGWSPVFLLVLAMTAVVELLLLRERLGRTALCRRLQPRGGPRRRPVGRPDPHRRVSGQRPACGHGRAAAGRAHWIGRSAGRRLVHPDLGDGGGGRRRIGAGRARHGYRRVAWEPCSSCWCRRC